MELVNSMHCCDRAFWRIADAHTMTDEEAQFARDGDGVARAHQPIEAVVRVDEAQRTIVAHNIARRPAAAEDEDEEDDDDEFAFD